MNKVSATFVFLFLVACAFSQPSPRDTGSFKVVFQRAAGAGSSVSGSSSNTYYTVDVLRYDTEGIGHWEGYGEYAVLSGSQTVTFNVNYNETTNPTGDARFRFYIMGTASPLGASWVAGSSDTRRLVAEYGSESGSVAEPYPTYDVQGVVPLPQSDGSKPIWVTDDSTLTGNLFREGIDKLVGKFGAADGASSSSSSSTTTDEKLQTIIDNQNRDSLPLYYVTHDTGVTANTDSLISAASTQSTAISSALGNASVSRGSGVSAVTIGGTGDVLASFSVAGPFSEIMSADFTPLAFTGPFAAFSGFSTTFIAYGAVVREILLWLAVLGLWYFSRSLLERYMLTFFAGSQTTTKVETAQITLPGVGHGKQLVTVLTIFSVFVGAIAATIVLLNTNLGYVISGLTTAGVTGLGGHLYDSLNAAAGSTVLGFFERFVPLAAMVECVIAQIVLSWSMPGVWAVCLTLAKVFHL